MSNELQFSLVVLGIPSLVITLCWIVLVVSMQKTTGELKLFLSPNNVVKMFAIYLIVAGTTLLGTLKILDGQSIGVIFSGVIGYVVGSQFNKE